MGTDPGWARCFGPIETAPIVQPQSDGNELSGFTAAPSRILVESATVRGRAWYKFLDAPVLNLGVTA